MSSEGASPNAPGTPHRCFPRSSPLAPRPSQQDPPCPNIATLYGLPSCDTCRKARKWLDRFGIPYAFVDYRADPVPAATLKAWAQQLGGWEKLVNKAGTTWRNLLPQRKNPGSDPEWTLLIKEYPALVRRPVVVLPDGRSAWASATTVQAPFVPGDR